MKKTIVSLSALSLILTAFMTNPTVATKKKVSSSDQMAERVVAAFQKTSSSDYASLFPSASDFKDIMKESAEVYGNNLHEAQREFERHYESDLIPSVKHSFDALVREGKEQGIDWSKVRYVGIEESEKPENRFSPVPVTIVFAANGVEHRIVMDRALVIDGQWNVSQFITLL